MYHIIALIMCSHAWYVTMLPLVLLAFRLPRVLYHSTQILFMCVMCHDVFTVTHGFRVPCGSHHITHMSVFLWSLLFLLPCVVCTHVYTGIPGSRVPSGLCHDINMRDITLVLCVTTFSLSILALGFLMFCDIH